MSKMKRRCTNDVSVVSYNVLSPQLGLPDDFYMSPLAAMNPKRRFSSVLAKIKPHVSRGAVICLQEVNESWSGKLYVWFAKRRYRMISSQYHRHFTGHMGVAIAFPIRFDIQSLQYVRPTDPPRFPVVADGQVVASVNGSASPVACKTGLDYKLRSTINVALFIRLRKRIKRKASDTLSVAGAPSLSQHVSFSVVTYHFPCEFRDPQYMTAVAGMLLKKASAFAGREPLIIAGDFNSTPDTAAYGVMTTGFPVSSDKKEDFSKLHVFGNRLFSFDEGDAAPSCSYKLSSVYKLKHGKEPDFTNYSRRRLHGGAEHHFRGTIDYIFVSKHWSVERVMGLPSASGLEVQSYPCEQEPSDHVLISASLSLNDDKKEQRPAHRPISGKVSSGAAASFIARAQRRRGTPPKKQQNA